MSEADDLEFKTRNMIKERLLAIPDELKKNVSPILLKKDLDFYSKTTSQYFLFVCTDSEERQSIEQRQKIFGEPFPHLITTNKTWKHMFSLDKSRNSAIGKMTLDVGSSYSFYIGKDSTLLLFDLGQKGVDESFGEFQYGLDLAFIISFGDEIQHDNVLDFLETLIAYALKIWKSDNERK